MAARNEKLSISTILRENRGLWTVYDRSWREVDVKIVHSPNCNCYRRVIYSEFTVDVSPSNIVDLFTAFKEILPAQ